MSKECNGKKNHPLCMHACLLACLLACKELLCTNLKVSLPHRKRNVTSKGAVDVCRTCDACNVSMTVWAVAPLRPRLQMSACG